MPIRINTKLYCKMTDSEFDRFKKYWDEPADLDACWNWTGASRNGYGLFGLRGAMVGTHRLALVQSSGLNPADLDCCHNCNNRKCVNPTHLRWDTRTNNLHDRIAAGTDPKGERHGMSKLTEEQILAIRADDRSQRIIATEYGVSQPLISKIKSGDAWKHLNSN
jgi:hypothetical protein